MELKVRMKLNSLIEIETSVEADDLQDVIKKAAPFLDFDGKCGLCSSTEIKLQTRDTKDKKFKYTEYVCLACGAKRTWGEYQDKSGFYLKQWEEKFQGGNKE